ncbi:MAG: hypothetical protein ACFFDD_09335 [Promethearchaeota archaeon]
MKIRNRDKEGVRRYGHMATHERLIARRIAFGYVILGVIYFLLWHFVINPAGYTDPFLNALFYISLPAILASPYVIFELVSEAVKGRMESSEDASPY